MTKDDILKLSIESYDQGVADAKQEALAALEQIVAAARAAEREACAKLCESHVRYPSRLHFANAIRARGTT
jgi:DNA-binding GntR family transcriptional regulator